MIRQAEFQQILTPEQKAQAELDSFVSNPALIELVTYFGFKEPEAGEDRLTALQTFMKQNWEVRNGAERHDVDWGSETEPEDPQTPEERAAKMVFDRCRELGMVDSSHPKYDRYDLVSILGGANKAPLDRLRYGLDQHVRIDALVMLGGARLVSEKERPKTDQYAPGAMTETDLMDAAVVRVFDRALENEEPFVVRERAPAEGSFAEPHYWEVHYFETKGGLPIFSSHPAFQSEPGRVKLPREERKSRPHSGDTYAFLRKLADPDGTMDSHARILFVTTGFYTNAQRLDAVREITLQTGAAVEVIGHSAAYTCANRTAKHLKQELKSAIDAAVRLRDAIAVI